MPISVHMLGLRLPMDCAHRCRNGQPAHSTTGVASASSIQTRRSGDRPCSSGVMASIARAMVATLNGRLHQKRRRKSVSSGFSPSSRLGSTGSRAMPQTGQVPGPSWTISGSIGQVYSVPAGTGAATCEEGSR
ncbi:hypothetical protein D3C81_1467030 [compost metagenome]